MQTEEKNFILFVALAFIILIAAAFMVWKLIFDKLKNRDLYEVKLMASKLEMQELTFQQISRELHDNVKLSLILSRLPLYTLQDTMADQESKEKVQSCITQIEKSLNSLDDIARSLNTDWISALGLPHALQKEIDELEASSLIKAETHFSEGRVELDKNKELVMFRVVQEALNNIIKHAGAKQVQLSLQYNNDHVILTITDDGKGFDYNTSVGKNNGTGLKNFKARASVLQAQLNIQSMPGKGTTIELTVPYAPNRQPVEKKEAGKFNFFERLMLVNAKTAIALINICGYSIFTNFLWERQWKAALIALLVSCIVVAVVIWKLDLQKLSQTIPGKAMLLHAKPVNVILRIAGLSLVCYGAWLDNYIVIGAGIFMALVTVAMVSKKEKEKLQA